MGREAWGKSRESGGGFKTWRLEDAKDCVYRLLSPHPRVAASGIWRLYLRQHWGYRRPSKKDPTKTVPVLFKCVRETGRDRMVTHDCGECLNIEQQRNRLTSMLDDLKAQGKSGTEIETMITPLRAWLLAHNVDSKFCFLAKSLAGESGVLQIPYKANLALDVFRKEMREKKIPDITDIDDGIWVSFKRTGRGADMVFSVHAHTETVIVGGEELQKIKRAPLTDAELDDMERRLPALIDNELTVVLTDAQIDALVSCGEDPYEVEKIVSMSQPRNESSPGPAVSKPVSSPAKSPTAPVVPKPPSTPPATVLKAPEVSQPPPEAAEDEVAALERRLAAAKAKRSAPQVTAPAQAAPQAPQVAAPAPQAASKPRLTSEQLDALSEEDFLRQFEK